MYHPAYEIPNYIWDYYKIPRPTVEYIFHEKRKWRIDFAWVNKKVAMEIQGGLHLGKKGGHTSIKGYKKDMEKFNRLNIDGWLLLLYAPYEEKYDEIKQVLLSREDLHDY